MQAIRKNKRKLSILGGTLLALVALSTGVALAQSQKRPDPPGILQQQVTVSAWAWQIHDLQPLPNGNYNVVFNVMFATTPTTAMQINVEIDPILDTPLTIRTKTSDAIQTQAAAQGITVPKARMILMEWQRGL